MQKALASAECWSAASPAACSWASRVHRHAEAIYSYEGTREINTLVVGRAITGFSAFV